MLWLRSGREHLGLELAVEVRQGTLGADGRGEHEKQMVAVEEAQDEDEEEAQEEVAEKEDEEEEMGLT